MCASRTIAPWYAISACAPTPPSTRALQRTPPRRLPLHRWPECLAEVHMNDASSRSWKLERDAEGVAWLTLDKPGTSANVLSTGVLQELNELLGALEQDRPRGAVLISAKKSGFVAGADIKEF